MSVADFVRLRLWVAAQYHATQAGYVFAENCAGDLRDLIADGVVRLEGEGALESDARVDLAEANLVVFVSKMIVEGPVGADRVLHEITFAAARRLLCPLWPFC